MKPKRTIQDKINAKKREAFALYQAGFTTREIGKKVDRSHACVALWIKELDKNFTSGKMETERSKSEIKIK